jgi:methylisocitrate lyase
MAEMVEIASRVTDGLSIPLICDADQAGETILNVHRTIKAYERAGVAAVHIEDTRNPKHMASVDAKLAAAITSLPAKPSPHNSLDSLVPIPDMQARIGTAVDARTDPDFIVIARSDVLFNGGDLSEAIERGQAYAEAGADMYMPIWMKPGQIDEIAKAVPIPLVDISQARREVQHSQLTLDIFTRFFLRAAAYEYRQHLQELMEAGEFVNERDRTMSGDSLDALIDNETYISLANRWANR